MDPVDLENLVDRALKQLPAERAPQTLLPRVMAAVQRPVGGSPSVRTWFDWPRMWQVASVAALILLVTGITWLLPRAQSTVSASTSGVVETLTTRVGDVVQGVSAVASVARILWDAFLQPLVGYLFVFVAVMSAACAAFGAALGRVAMGGASQP